ncbi:MFS transporter [Cellulosimicrobium marinum]|uniref:MFS transporter n=1 Tax=Cellulosimicrobium marinum TaxID=1638992 RepID=UPI001E64493F|nr:MFS transporter [Cellulosimicrobium marinum]MCB7135863.1 MFS transporter [Cellulosimicrobium marinum]
MSTIPTIAGSDHALRSLVQRARWALMAQFVLFGVIGTSWMSRLPSVRDALGLSSGQLGALLVVGGVGSLVAVVATGAVVARFGNRATLVAGTVGNVVGLGLVALGTGTGSVGFFAAGAFLNGMSGALVNVPINICAAGVEKAVGRAILPHFHAAFSIGAAGGALVAAAFSWAHVGITVQLVVVTLVVAGLRAVLVAPATALAPERVAQARTGAAPAVTVPGTAAATSGTADLPDDAAATPVPAPRRGAGVRAALAAWREPRTLLIGLVLLASSLSEGSASTWLSIAVVDGFDVREALGAVAYGTFVGAMTVFRFAGTGLIDRFGRVAVLRASGVSALLGLLAFGLAPTLPLAWVGIVLWGCGAALANPVAIAAASDDPAHAAPRVAVATSFSTIAMLSAPPLLGLLVDGVGARHALLVICAATVLSLAVAGAVRPEHERPRAAVRG